MGLIGVWCKLCGKKTVLDYNDVEDGSVTKCDHDCGNEFHWNHGPSHVLYPKGGNLADADVAFRNPGGDT